MEFVVEQSAMMNEEEDEGDYLICTEDEQVMVVKEESVSDVPSIVQEPQPCSQNPTENECVYFLLLIISIFCFS